MKKEIEMQSKKDAENATDRNNEMNEDPQVDDEDDSSYDESRTKSSLIQEKKMQNALVNLKQKGAISNNEQLQEAPEEENNNKKPSYDTKAKASLFLKQLTSHY